MKILGICHDVLICSAAVVVDGQVVAAIPEERLDRQKQSRSFPTLAIQRCLDEAGSRCATSTRSRRVEPGDRSGDHARRLPLRARWRVEHLSQVPARFMQTARHGRRRRAHDSRARRKGCPPITFVNHYDAHIGNALFPEPVRGGGDRWCSTAAPRSTRACSRRGTGRADRDARGGLLPAFARALLRRGHAVSRLQARLRRVEGDGARRVRRRRQRVLRAAAGS